MIIELKMVLMLFNGVKKLIKEHYNILFIKLKNKKLVMIILMKDLLVLPRQMKMWLISLNLNLLVTKKLRNNS